MVGARRRRRSRRRVPARSTQAAFAPDALPDLAAAARGARAGRGGAAVAASRAALLGEAAAPARAVLVAGAAARRCRRARPWRTAGGRCGTCCGARRRSGSRRRRDLGAAIRRTADREPRAARVSRTAAWPSTTSTRAATWSSRWSAEPRRRDLIRRREHGGCRGAARRSVRSVGRRPRRIWPTPWPRRWPCRSPTDPHAMTFAPDALLARRDAPAVRPAGRRRAAARGARRSRRRAGHRRVGAPELAGPARAGGGPARRRGPRGRVPAVGRGVRGARRDAAAAARPPGCRSSRFVRRTTRSGRSTFPASYDERSDRRQPLAELMDRGYEDAYHQFIEPVVGASGEQLGAGNVERR